MFLPVFFCNAQVDRFHGLVKDRDTDKVLAGTTVELVAADSVLDRTHADDEGKFDLRLHPVATELWVRHKGYADTFILIASERFEEKPLVIYLQREVLRIKEVIVEKKIPNITFDGEKMIVNNRYFIDNSIDGLEAIGKIPGALLDDNSLTINGRSDYTILFNGVQTTMDNAQAIAMLKGMSPSLIDRVELTLGGRASQDAGGGGGVIDIITKEPFSHKYYVFLGNNMLVDRKNVGSNHSAYLYYRIKKLSFYYITGLTNNRNYRSSQVRSRYFDDDGSFSDLAVDGSSNSRDLYWTNSLGINYELGKRTKLGLFSVLNTDDYHSNEGNLTVSEGKANYSARYANRSRSDALFSTLNFNAHHKVDSLGSDLKFLAGRIGGYSKDWSDLEYDYLSATDNVDLRNHAPMDGSQYQVKLDFKKVFRSKNRLEMGFKSTFGKLDNDFTQDTLAPSFIPSAGISPFKMGYREDIVAGYTMAVLKSGFFYLVPGLRYEHVAMENRYAGSGDRFKLRFSDFFPSVRFGIDKPKISSSISVSRSIYRPPFAYINDYERQISNYSYERGNPNLTPQYSWNFGLNSFIYGFWHLNLVFSKTEDVIVRTIRPVADKELYTIAQPNNALNRDMLSLSTGADYDRIKKLEIGISFSGSMARYMVKKGFEYVNPPSKWNLSHGFSVRSAYKLPKSFRISNQLSFRSGQESHQSTTKSYWMDNISLTKGFDNNRFTATLAVTDVFDSYRSVIRTTSAQYFSDSRFFPVMQKVRLGFAFYFGKLNKNVNVDYSLEEDAGRFIKEND